MCVEDSKIIIAKYTRNVLWPIKKEKITELPLSSIENNGLVIGSMNTNKLVTIKQEAISHFPNRQQRVTSKNNVSFHVDGECVPKISQGGYGAIAYKNKVLSYKHQDKKPACAYLYKFGPGYSVTEKECNFLSSSWLDQNTALALRGTEPNQHDFWYWITVEPSSKQNEILKKNCLVITQTSSQVPSYEEWEQTIKQEDSISKIYACVDLTNSLERALSCGKNKQLCFEIPQKEARCKSMASSCLVGNGTNNFFTMYYPGTQGLELGFQKIFYIGSEHTSNDNTNTKEYSLSFKGDEDGNPKKIAELYCSQSGELIVVPKSSVIAQYQQKGSQKFFNSPQQLVSNNLYSFKVGAIYYTFGLASLEQQQVDSLRNLQDVRLLV